MLTVKWDNFNYSRTQMGIWRIAFGIYLTCYSIMLLPYTSELYSNRGPYQDLEAFSAAHSLFPRFLLEFDSESFVYGMAIACVVFSVLITLGYARKSAAALLWLCMVWFSNRNPSTVSPEFEFTNWLIFALVFIPTGERFSIGKKDPKWAMPANFYWGAWIVLAAGYFYSGSQKFAHHDFSWLDGRAMYIVVAQNTARSAWYGDFFDIVPMAIFRIATWTALCTQTLAGLFMVFRITRPWWWLLATLVHIFLLFVLNFSQLTLGMILFHFFIFDLNWFNQIRSKFRSSQDASRANPLGLNLT